MTYVKRHHDFQQAVIDMMNERPLESVSAQSQALAGSVMAVNDMTEEQGRALLVDISKAIGKHIAKNAMRVGAGGAT